MNVQDFLAKWTKHFRMMPGSQAHIEFVTDVGKLTQKIAPTSVLVQNDPEKQKGKKRTGYRCQFCGEHSPAKEWKADICPKCDKPYDAILAQDEETD